MRLWFAVSAGVSLLVLAALLIPMTSCTRDFEIDPQGRLVQVTTIQTEGNPPVRQVHVKNWASELPEFPDIAARLLPGDRLTHTRHITGFPVFNLEMTRLDVVRNEVRVMVVRSGALSFWSVIVGISLFPLLCWAGGALWSLSSRPHRVGP